VMNTPSPVLEISTDNHTSLNRAPIERRRRFSMSAPVAISTRCY
jgi:hypothetical protein